MATITTHPGGPFYVWYVSVYGVAPPATVDSNAARYLAWTEGMPKALAATIPYGSIGPPGDFVAGAALVAPVVITTPASPTPVTAPAATLVEAGVTQVATPAPAAPPVGAGGPAASASAYSYSNAQILNVDAVMTACDNHQVSDNVRLAMALIGVAENEWSSTTCNPTNHCGVFQLDSGWQAKHSYEDTEYWADYALTNGFYGHGGMIEIVADPTEAEAAAYYQGRITEAQWVVATYGKHVSGTSGSGSNSGTSPSTPTEAPPSTSTIQGLQSLVHELDWSGDFENLWDALATGCKTVDDTAQTLYTHISGITTIGWT
jgi:hypothetical protein